MVILALLAVGGCSTNERLLEPGVDKRQGVVSPEYPPMKCCTLSTCGCASGNPCPYCPEDTHVR